MHKTNAGNASEGLLRKMFTIHEPYETGQEDNEFRRLETLLTPFDTISLAELQQEAALLDRVDTKYIIGMDQLYAILPKLSEHYRALTINDTRLHAYQTLYFDTSGFTFYEQHHNGVASRYKVRARKYLDTDMAFFEIKHRTNQHRTIKSRLPIPDVMTRLDDQLAEFTLEHAACNPDRLEPKLWNEYVRLTLVSRDRPERVTLDMNLRFRWHGAYTDLPGVVIVEVKQARRSQATALIRQMRQSGIRPFSYSKYAAGVYSLYDGVKINNFKAQMRQVNKVIQRMFGYESAFAG